MTAKSIPPLPDPEREKEAGKTKETPPSAVASVDVHTVPRRNVLTCVLASVIGGIVAVFPFAAGLLAFLDPLRGKRRRTPLEEVSRVDDKGFIRVANLDGVPPGAKPELFQVVSERTDAWTYFPEERVGSIYLQRTKDGAATPEQSLLCFNSQCPHAGCAVDYVADKDAYFCPCHNSTFSLTGERSADSPSARDLDRLEIDVRKDETGKDVIWVKFENFRTGTAERIPE